jgi:hypothetical protein
MLVDNLRYSVGKEIAYPNTSIRRHTNTTRPSANGNIHYGCAINDFAYSARLIAGYIQGTIRRLRNTHRSFANINELDELATPELSHLIGIGKYNPDINLICIYTNSTRE